MAALEASLDRRKRPKRTAKKTAKRTSKRTKDQAHAHACAAQRLRPA